MIMSPLRIGMPVVDRSTGETGTVSAWSDGNYVEVKWDQQDVDGEFFTDIDWTDPDLIERSE